MRSQQGVMFTSTLSSRVFATHASDMATIFEMYLTGKRAPNLHFITEQLIADLFSAIERVEMGDISDISILSSVVNMLLVSPNISTIKIKELVSMVVSFIDLLKLFIQSSNNIPRESIARMRDVCNDLAQTALASIP